MTSGSGKTATVDWNGKDANGFPHVPGNYSGTLIGSAPGCSDVSTTFTAQVADPPNDSTGFCGFGSNANLAGGNLSHRDDIISVSGAMLPLSLSIDYNSQDISVSTLGGHWRHSLDITLSDAGNGALLFREGGTRKLYTYNNGVYLTPAGDHGVLTGSANNPYDLTYRSGLVYHFLANGKIEFIKDLYGNKLLFAYSGDSLYTVTDSNGRSLTFNYDGGWLQSVSDPNGNLYTFTPQEGRLWKVTNPQTDTGIIASFREYLYDTNGLLTFRRDPNNNLTQYSYDGPSKSVVASIDPDGSVNPQNHTRIITYPTPEPISTSSIMTTNFREKDGGVWNYTYDTKKGVLISITAPPIPPDTTGKTSDYYYDDFGNLTALTTPYNVNTSYTTFYSYDGFGNLLTETDPIDISGYYGQGLDPATATPTSLALLDPPIKPALRYGWGSNDRLISFSNERDTTILSATVIYQTDDTTRLELTTITDPENKITKIRRDTTTGKVMEVEDGNGKKTVFTYYAVNSEDSNSGQLKSITGPDNVKTTFGGYDRNGNPGTIQVTDADNNPVPVNTTLAFDALNRLRNITRNLTSQSKTLTGTFDYDQYGSLTVKDPEQNANGTRGTRYDFNYNSRVKRITDALAHVTDLTYGGQACASCGGVDQLTAVKDPRQYALGVNGKSTMFLYDKAGRLERETYPAETISGKIVRYTYYDNGLLKEKYDATSGDPGTRLLLYTYNNRGQLTEKLRNDGGKDSFTYKTNGYLDTATTRNPDNSILINYTFDWYKNGRLKSVSDTINNRTINYDLYDEIGQRKTVTYFPGTPDQRVITYDYDAANRPSHITDAANAITFTYGYDERGRRKTLTYPGSNPIVATYGFDDLDRLTSLNHQAQNGSPLIASLTYPEYDGADNRKNKSIMTSSDTTAESYAYDLLYRIYQTATPVGTEEFHYDEAGNRTYGPGPMDTRYLADEANRMTKGRLFDYGYDNRGNQTTRTVPNAIDKSWTQQWDSEDRLVKVEKTKEIRDTNGVLQRTDKRIVTFSYDPFGRRIGKTFTILNGSVTKAGGAWKYVYDNEDVVLETYTELNKPSENSFYIHGPGIDEPLALVRGGQYYTYHADGLGSIVAIVDQGKSVVERYSYDTYGMPTPTTGFRNTYTYTAREIDKEAGLLFYRSRYRDLLDGNFISKDKFGFAAGDVNLWNYVQSNPINWTDPLGLYIGQYPPVPSGYNTATWQTGKWDNGKWFVKSPDGRIFTVHPEDKGHWRHWDIQYPDDRNDNSDPPNPDKPRSNQKRKLKRNQCDADPSGDAPEWTPPVMPFVFTDPSPLPSFRLSFSIRFPIIRVPAFAW